MFSIDPSPPPEIKLLRRELTTRYANITLVISFIVLLFIGVRAFAAPYLPRFIRRPVSLMLVVPLTFGILVLLSVLQTHDDYLFLTKRLGRYGFFQKWIVIFQDLRANIMKVYLPPLCPH